MKSGKTRRTYYTQPSEHTTNSLKRKLGNICFNKSLLVQLNIYKFCPVLKCKFCLLFFPSVSALCIILCDSDNPSFPKYWVEIGSFFLHDSDGLPFDSLRGVKLHLLKGYFFPNRDYLSKYVKKNIRTIQLQQLSRNIKPFIDI